MLKDNLLVEGGIDDSGDGRFGEWFECGDEFDDEFVDDDPFDEELLCVCSIVLGVLSVKLPLLFLPLRAMMLQLSWCSVKKKKEKLL